MCSLGCSKEYVIFFRWKISIKERKKSKAECVFCVSCVCAIPVIPAILLLRFEKMLQVCWFLFCAKIHNVAYWWICCVNQQISSIRFIKWDCIAKFQPIYLFIYSNNTGLPTYIESLFLSATEQYISVLDCISVDITLKID